MTQLKFIENSKAIFDKSVEETPLPFRGTVRDGLTKLLEENYGNDGEISEERIVKMIKKNTPKMFLAKGMKAIAPLLSDPSLAEL